MNEKLFNYAGTSVYTNGEMKVRFAVDNVARTKVNIKRGNDDVKFHPLPSPMAKMEACRYLLENVELTPEERFAVTARVADLRKIERRESRKNGEVAVIRTADQLLQALGGAAAVKSGKRTRV